MYHSTCNPFQKLRYFIHVYVYIFYLFFLLSLCDKLHVCMTAHLGCNWPASDLSTDTQGSWLSCQSGQPLTLSSLRPGPCLVSRFSIKADCTHKSMGARKNSRRALPSSTCSPLASSSVTGHTALLPWWGSNPEDQVPNDLSEVRVRGTLTGPGAPEGSVK